jgi:protein ImuB
LRLNQSALRAEVIRISLTVPLSATLAPRTGDLFVRENSSSDALNFTLDRLRARLGEAAIVRPTLSADHRLRVQHPQVGLPPEAPRPLLLAPHPERIARQQLDLINGPERIESGWWDGADQARDYWVARRTDGALLLVYEDLRARDNWWLEGFFE